MTRERPRVLCVDDEPRVLEALEVNLGRAWDVSTATSGAAGLEAIARQGPFVVVVSDMRMPGMDGAAFLSRVRQAAPDTVRLLLTGQADLQAAIAAVNEGQIFRFLTKPCPPPTLEAALRAAAEQHRLVTAERVLLEQTLRGAVQALSDVLALASPRAFGRAQRLGRRAVDLARRLGVGELWAVEVAATLSQLGCVTLPPELVDKLLRGEELDRDEQAATARLPAVANELLGKIPRLDLVRDILTRAAWPCDPRAALGDAALAGAEALRVALAFDVLEARGNSFVNAVATLRGRGNAYHPAVLEALEATHGTGEGTRKVLELQLGAVTVGMILVDDVHLPNGALLVTRGYEVTPAFVARARHFGPPLSRMPVRVFVEG